MTTPLVDRRCLLIDPTRPAELARDYTRITFPRRKIVLFGVAGPLLMLSGLLGGGPSPFFIGLALPPCLAWAMRATRSRLTTGLVSFGFRPGTTVSVDYFSDAFCITTSTSSARYDYTDVRSIRQGGTTVLVRIGPTPITITLPQELVPADAYDYLRTVTTGRSAAAGVASGARR